MPTAYTDQIANGMTFKEFASQFVQKVHEEHFHERELARWEDKLKFYQHLSQDEDVALAAAEWEDIERERLSKLKAYETLRSQYEAMLAQVDAWVPPTPAHKKCQETMREQILSSIRVDCCDEFYRIPTPRVILNVWMTKKIENCRWHIAYQKQKILDQAALRDNAAEFARQLYASIEA